MLRKIVIGGTIILVMAFTIAVVTLQLRIWLGACG